MSKKRPAGSAKLERLFDVIKKVEFQIIQNASDRQSSVGAVVTECADAVLAEMNPDDLKTVLDKIESEAGKWLAEATKFTDIANGLDDAANEIRERFKLMMIANGKGDLKGPTFTASLKEGEPRISIDWEVLKKDGDKFKGQVTVFDEAKIMAAIAAGEVVPGVTTEKVTVLEISVEKKAPAK